MWAFTCLGVDFSMFALTSNVLMSLYTCIIGLWGSFLFVLFFWGESWWGFLLLCFRVMVRGVAGGFSFFCPITRSTLPKQQLVADVLVFAWIFYYVDRGNTYSISSKHLQWVCAVKKREFCLSWKPQNCRFWTKSKKSNKVEGKSTDGAG